VFIPVFIAGLLVQPSTELLIEGEGGLSTKAHRNCLVSHTYFTPKTILFV
jgi:hypothetical protein